MAYITNIENDIKKTKEAIKLRKDLVNENLNDITALERELEELEKKKENAKKDEETIAKFRKDLLRAETNYFIAMGYIEPDEADEYAERREAALIHMDNLFDSLKGIFC